MGGVRDVLTAIHVCGQECDLGARYGESRQSGRGDHHQPKLEEAADAIGRARLNLLKEGALATDVDVTELRRIKAESE